MKLGTKVRLGAGHILLNEDHLRLPKTGSPLFSAHVCCGPAAAWVD